MDLCDTYRQDQDLNDTSRAFLNAALASEPMHRTLKSFQQRASVTLTLGFQDLLTAYLGTNLVSLSGRGGAQAKWAWINLGIVCSVCV